MLSRSLTFFRIAPAALALLVAVADSSAAQERFGRYSGEPLPRFASLKAEEAHFRKGPGADYAIQWVLRRRHLPVRVIGEYGPWRRVELHTGERGWIHRALLSTRRYATPITRGAELFAKPRADAEELTRLAATLPLRLRRCTKEWCQVDVTAPAKEDGALHSVTGWALKRSLWGVTPEDVFN